MFGRNAKIDALKRVPLFSSCSRRELAEVAAVADEVHFASGRTLIREGAAGRELVVIVDGTVEVEREGRPVAIEGDASFFGEAALLTGAPRNATVTTTSAVRALIVTDRAFERLLEDVPSVKAKVFDALSRRRGAAD
jgi:CRP/FNR family transcriptional regulator, cyclic AMP receptor protein